MSALMVFLIICGILVTFFAAVAAVLLIGFWVVRGGVQYFIGRGLNL